MVAHHSPELKTRKPHPAFFPLFLALLHSTSRPGEALELTAIVPGSPRLDMSTLIWGCIWSHANLCVCCFQMSRPVGSALKAWPNSNTMMPSFHYKFTWRGGNALRGQYVKEATSFFNWNLEHNTLGSKAWDFGILGSWFNIRPHILGMSTTFHKAIRHVLNDCQVRSHVMTLGSWVLFGQTCLDPGVATNWEWSAPCLNCRNIVPKTSVMHCMWTYPPVRNGQRLCLD